MTYRLYYWPMLPGRGEIIRLVLEEAGADYVDVAQAEGVQAILPHMYGEGEGPPTYAPPILERGSLRLGQTAAICDFLAAEHGLVVPQTAELRARALQLFLTVLDAVDEAHDTHHPLGKSKYYEDQKEAAKTASAAFIADRLPKLLGYFERVIEHAGGAYLLGEPSYVDLGLLQLLLGLEYAFPKAMAKALEAVPGLVRLRDRTLARPRVARFKASERSVAFTNDGIFRRYPELDIA